MTYLFTDPQPITGNIGVLTSGAIVTNANPFPVTLGAAGSNINVSGNINVPGNVEVYSSPENPVHVHLSEVGNYGLLDQFVPVSGTVYLGANTLANLSHINANITNSSISVKQSGDWTVGISNVNVNVSQYGLWNVGILGVPTVDVRSMPANASVLVTGNVNISAMPTVTLTSNAVNATVSGTVTLTSNAVNATVSGTVNAVQSGVWYANINNFPTSTQVTNNGTFAVQATQSGTWYANINNFPTSQTISGNVGIISNNAIVSNTNPFPVSGTVEIKNDAGVPINIVLNDGGQLGAFGRLRTTSSSTINEYKTLYGVQTGVGDFVNHLNGAGSVTFNGNESHYSLNVGTASGDYAIRQSVEYHPYKPGCGQDIIMTGCMAVTKNNLTQRIGYFDDRDGIFFERATDQNGVTTNSWNIRSYAGGSANIAETVDQASWNIDTFGAGTLSPSGLTIDWTKAHIWFIDFQWLGVGRVRVGFIINGLTYYAHEFDHYNNITVPYMSNPTLPIRYEIRNTGNTSGNSSLTAICAVVSSEGGLEDQAWTFCANTTPSGVTVSTTEHGVIAIRLKNTLGSFNKPNRAAARLINYALYATQSTHYRILHCGNLSGTISGTPTWTSVSNSSYVEYTTDFNFVSNYMANCIPINSGFVATAQGSASGSANYLVSSKKGQIHQNYDSTDSQIIVIAANRIGNQDSIVYANMDWLELK